MDLMSDVRASVSKPPAVIKSTLRKQMWLEAFYRQFLPPLLPSTGHYKQHTIFTQKKPSINHVLVKIEQVLI